MTDVAPDVAAEVQEPEPIPAPDPAAASAAADPLPGTKRRGRPRGSKNKAPRTEAQIAAARANLAKSRTHAAPVKTGPTDAQLRDAVAQLYAMTGMGLAFMDQEIGQAVATQAEAAATAWLHLAQQNPAVRRALVSLTTASATGELLMAHAPIVAVAVSRIQARQRQAPVPSTAEANGAGDSPPDWSSAPPPFVAPSVL